MSDQTVERRDYQIALKQQTYDAWGSRRNALNVLATGGGKSVIMSGIARDGMQQGFTQCVIAHRNELVSQMSAHIGREGVPHRIVGSDATVNQIRRQHRALFNGQQFVHPTSRTSVIGVDTLIARKNDLEKWAWQHDHWMGDECFPAGTLITTTDGYSPIEHLNIGDEVIAFDENSGRFESKKIARLFKNPKPDKMVRLTTSTHHVIETTYEHPFWTKRGWVEAMNLKENDDVLLLRMFSGDTENNRESAVSLEENRENLLSKKMRLFRAAKTIFKNEATPSCKTMPNLFYHPQSSECENLFQGMYGKNNVRNNGSNESEIRIKTDEREQPDEIRRISRENVKNITAHQTQTITAGRQWEENPSRRTMFDRFSECVRICSSICNKNWNEKRNRLSTMLQTRHGTSATENSDRSRRQQSRAIVEKSARSEKRYISEFIRVESVEIFQSGNTGKDSGDYVYNIEVDDLHTYVANNIVVHNCHHFLRANKWGQAVAMMPNALGAGFTATPTRADGQGLGREFDGVFDVMNIGPSMRQLIQRNYLCDFEIVCPRSDMQVSESETSASGDWSNSTLRKAAKKSHIVGDVVENYCKYAFGRRAIVFATDVETANEIAVKFNEWGIRAASLSAKTPLPVREKYIGEFKSGKLTVLINVDLFDEGFDVPACDVVIMARPTASLGKYRQMVGRALRFQIGKVALIIDMVSNIIRHHLPDKDIVWSLGRRDKRAKQVRDPDEIPLTTCNTCTKPYERFMVACPYCGAQKPLPSPRERTLEMVEGDLILLDREMLAKMRAGTVLESPGDIAARVAHVAGPFAGAAASKRQLEKIEAHGHLRETLAQWAAIDRAAGYSDSEIHRRFWHVTGMDVLTALDASRPRSEMDSLNQTIQQWWRKG